MILQFNNDGKFLKDKISFNNIFTQSNIDQGQIDDVWTKWSEYSQQADATTLGFASTLDKTNGIFKNYFETVDSGTISKEGLTKAVSSLGGAFDLATIKATAANVALNAGIGIAISLAVAFGSKLLDALIATQEELEEAAATSKEAFESTQSAIEDINSQLGENVQKINELKAKGKLTYVEQSELNKLEETNKKLERQLELLERQEIIQGYQAAEDAGKTLGEYRFQSVYYNEKYGNVANAVAQGATNDKFLLKDTKDLEAQIYLYTKYNNIMKDSATSIDEYTNANNIATEAEQNLIDVMSDVESTLNDMEYAYDIISKKSESNLTSQERTIKTTYEKYNEQYLELQKLLDPSTFYETAFDDIFSNDNLEETQDLLVKLSKTGKLKSSTINSYEDLEDALKNTNVAANDLIDELKDNGISANELAVQIEALANDPSSSIAGLTNKTEVLSAALKTAKENTEDLMTAMNNSVGASGLDSDDITNIASQFAGLDGYDADKLFERTANGIHLNSDELTKLNKKVEENQKLAFKEHLEDLTEEYQETCKELAHFNGNLAEKNKLLSKRDALEDEIKTTRDLAAQYDGLTSAYNKWLNAKDTDNEGAMFDAIKDGYEDMKALADNGDWGVDELEEYIHLLTGKDVSTASIEETKKAWQEAKKAKAKYYTEDDNVGLMNFLNDAKKKSSGVTQSKDGTWNIDVDTEQLASDMGVGVELVESMLKKLIDKKWDIDFGDSVDNLAALQSQAEKTLSELNKLSDGKYDDINLDVESVEDVNKEIQKTEDYLKDATDPKQIEKLNDLLDYLKTRMASISDEGYGEINYFKDMENDITDITESYEDLKGILEKEIDINFKTDNVDELNEDIFEIQDILRDFYKNGKIDIEADGAEEAIEVLSGLLSKKAELENPAIMDIELDTEQAETDLGKAVSLIQDYQDAINEFNVEVQLQRQGVDIDTTESKKKIDDLYKQIQGLDSSITAQLQIDSTSKETLNASIKEIQLDDLEASLKVSKDEALKDVNEFKEALDKIKTDVVSNITAKIKGLTDVKQLSNLISNLSSKSINITANVKTNTSSTNISTKPYYKGTAHAQGSAFARGNWAVKNSSRALMGELGAEMIVRDGKWFTVGDNAPTFFDVKKNDIIFDHIQTEQLLHGNNVAKMMSKGNAHIKGTAYATATGGGSSLTANKTIKSSTKKSSSSSSSKSSSSSDDDFLETFDYIEIKIDRIERAIESLDLKAGSTYSSWSSRNTALSSEMSKIKTQIDANTKGYEAYLKKANSLGLSSTYINKIKNGSISLQDITNEDLVDKIKEYQDLYEKAISLKQSTEELNEQLKELAQQKFDNLAKQYEDILSTFDSKSNALETIIDTQELKGFADSVKYYEELLKTNNSTLTNLEKEKSALISSLNEAVNSGYITKNSEAWYELKQEIDDVQQSIYEAEQAAQEFKNTIEEISWDNFDSLQEKISDIVAESEFLNDLLSNKDLFDDNGNFTTEGQSSMALYGINYNTYMKQADEYAQALKELDEQYKNDSLNTRYLERRQELVETQRDLILNAEEEKQNMIELKEEGYDAMLDSLDELIEKRKELNDTVRDFYDYEKEIAEKTKEVNNLEKKLSAFGGDTSEESKKTIQELKVELQEAKDDLRETEYDKYISDQEKLLDNIYSETETWINERLDNADELLQNIIDEVNADSGIISETIREQAENVGYTLSNSMNTILGEGGANITSPITNMLSIYNQNFSTQMTSLITAVNNIKTLVGGQEEKANANATSQVKTATTNSSSTASKSTTSASTSTSTKTSSTSSANSSANNIFTYQKFTGNKSKLNYKTSIVD